MARYIMIETNDGNVAVCFPDPSGNDSDEDYLRPGEDIIKRGEFDIDFDDPDCPFILGTVYREG